MAKYRIGFHRNQGGESQDIGPIGEYVILLSQAGVEPALVCIDEAGHAVEVAEAGGIAIFAKDEWRYPPNYTSGNPSLDAQDRWVTIRVLMPREIAAIKGSVWLIILNEPDKEHADYVHRFMLEIARLANADGYKVCGPNWSGGTPEVDAWETEAGRAWLTYCGNNPDKARVGLHEYSFDPDDLKIGSPWLIGRYQFILDVCDDHDIPHPEFLITECGWDHRDMPDVEEAMAQIPFLAEIYGDTPIALWTLGQWKHGTNLPPKMAKIVRPVTEWMLENNQGEEPPPPPPPDPDPVDWRRAVWDASIEEQQARGITLNPEHGLEELIYARPGYQVVTREITKKLPDGTAYGVMAAEHLGGEEPRIVLAFKRPWSGPGGVEVLTKEDIPEPEPEPFSWRAWPTEHRVVTQTAGNNPAYYGKIAPEFEGHEGLDLRAPMGSPVFSVDVGVVSDLRQSGDASHPYGRFVRVRHEGGYETTYAHLDSIAVSVGERVEVGQVIGTADNTGNIVEGSSHLHVTLKKDGVIVDPTPFALPWKPDFPNLPPAAHGITICDVSHHQGAIDFHKMMRRGAHACYIRGSMGGAGMDNTFVANWNAITRVPMRRGMYHLFRSDSSARANLDNILRTVEKHGAGDLRIAIDVEPVTNLPRVNGNRVTELIQMFKDAFGYSPLLYTGLWVLSRTDGDISWILHPHLWLASYWQSPPQMNQFPQLPIGGELSKLLAHQFTSSYYDGRKWGVGTLGLDVNVVYNLDRLLIDSNAPPPPPAPTIDMAQYFLPRQGDFGDIVILKNNWGQGDERQQLQRDGGTAYVTKNQQWERRRINNTTINLDLDTSPGNNRYYRVETATGWMPRHWRPGETFTRVETARFFNKGDCSQTGEALSGTSNLLFAQLHNLYTTRGGITFPTVAEIHWIRNGVTEEQYFYSAGYGLIAWKNRGGRESWATEVIPRGQQGDNTRESGCFA